MPPGIEGGPGGKGFGPPGRPVRVCHLEDVRAVEGHGVDAESRDGAEHEGEQKHPGEDRWLAAPCSRRRAWRRRRVALRRMGAPDTPLRRMFKRSFSRGRGAVMPGGG